MTKKILIVEDETIIAMEYRMDLILEGYLGVSIVSTAAEAIKSNERENPDLILMDIKLKGNKSGLDAAIEIRRKSNVPILFVTGNSDIRTLEQMKAMDNSVILIKPLHTKDLLREIKRIFNLS